MNQVSFTDLTAEIAVGASRSEVIVKLREAEGSISVAQMAKRTGLHINTARFHLDGLVSDGLALRTVETSRTRGRPRVLYTSRDADGPRSFALLAQMLTALVAALDGTSGVALNVGRTWGRNLVDRVSPEDQLDLDDGLARFKALLEAIGFQPEIARLPGGQAEVRLHHCPFREVAERHADVVCTLHLGLMQGALSQIGAPVEALPLKPFVTPNLCTSRLRALPKSNT
ncbi:MAG TPA: hypothetical protein VMV52_01200 [Candidatus Nanopelagicaceae bacterium]|nr:hypothetical protein [Candidatus Nanopelagicaceae bacterium]